MNNRAIEYVKKTIREYHEGNKQNGESIEEFIQNADYDIQTEVEEIFSKFLYPIPNNREVLMRQQENPLNPRRQQLKIKNMQKIEQTLNNLKEN